MIKVTWSLQHWMLANGYQKELTYLWFGHGEYLTKEMEKSYLDWCKTEDGRSYLKGGKNYKEVPR